MKTKVEKMIHLDFQYLDAQEAGDNRHAQQAFKDLGIEYEFAVPQTMGDCWWFFNCKNIPENLPSHINIRNFTKEDYDYCKN